VVAGRFGVRQVRRNNSNSLLVHYTSGEGVGGVLKNGMAMWGGGVRNRKSIAANTWSGNANFNGRLNYSLDRSRDHLLLLGAEAGDLMGRRAKRGDSEGSRLAKASAGKDRLKFSGGKHTMQIGAYLEAAKERVRRLTK